MITAVECRGFRNLTDAGTELRPGVVVVHGPNGAGKSTMLALLGTLLRPSTGRILYGKYDASHHGASLRASIGVRTAAVYSSAMNPMPVGSWGLGDGTSTSKPDRVALIGYPTAMSVGLNA